MSKPTRAQALAWARQTQVSEPSSQRLEAFAQAVWEAAQTQMLAEIDALAAEQRRPQNLNYDPVQKLVDAIHQHFDNQR